MRLGKSRQKEDIMSRNSKTNQHFLKPNNFKSIKNN